MAKGDSRTVQLIIGARDATAAAFKSVTGSLDKVRLSAVAAAGAIATAVAGFISGKLFAGAIESAGDFEQAMAKIQAVARATPEDFAKLKAAAEQAGSTTQFTATEAAGALEILARSGQSAEQAIATLPAVLALATAEGLSLDKSADAVTKTLAQFGLGVEAAGRVADVLVATSQRAATNVDQLGEALKYAGIPAGQFGMEMEDVLGYLGKLADAGLRGEQAGNGLANIISAVNDSSSKASRALRDMGITTTDLGEILSELSRRGDAADSVIMAFDSSVNSHIRTLIANSAAARELGESLGAVSGSAAEAANIMGSTFQGSVLGLQSAWDALRRALVEPLLQPLAKEFNALSEGIRSVTTNGLESFRAAALQAFETAAASVRKFLAEVKPEELLQKLGRIVQGVTSAAATIVNSFNVVGRVISGVIAAVEIAFNALKTVVSGIAVTLTAPFALVAKGVQGVTGILANLGVMSDETRAKIDNFSQILVDLNTGALESTQDGLRNADAAFADLGRAITGAEKPAEQTTRAVSGLAEEIERLPDPVDDANEALRKLVEQGADLAQIEAAQAKVNEEMRRAADQAVALEKAYAESVKELDALVAAGAGIDDIRAAMERSVIAQDAYAEALGRTTDEFVAQARAADSVATGQERVTDTVNELRQQAERLGLTWDAVTNTLTDGTKQNINDLRALAQSGQVTGQQLRQALDFSINAAKSEADLEAIRAAWVELGRDGKISGEELKAGLAALDQSLGESSKAAETLTERMNRAADALKEKRDASQAAAGAARENAQAMREEAAAAAQVAAEAKQASEAQAKADREAAAAAKEAAAEKRRMALAAQRAAHNARLLADAQREANSTTRSLTIQLAQMRGELVRAAKLQLEQEIARIEAEIVKARIERDAARVKDLENGLKIMRQIGAEQIKQAKEAEKQAKVQERESETRSLRIPQQSPQQPPSGAPTKNLGKLTLDIGGRNVEVFADDATAALLRRLIQEQARAQ